MDRVHSHVYFRSVIEFLIPVTAWFALEQKEKLMLKGTSCRSCDYNSVFVISAFSTKTERETNNLKLWI